MPKYLVPIDLSGNEIRNSLIQQLGVAPTAEAGRWYLDTTTSPYKLKYHNGTGWITLDGITVAALDDLTDVTITAAADGDVLVHNGTVWVDINFDGRVRTSRLDQMAVPTAAVSLNGQKVTNLAAPTVDTDAVTKSYADALRQGMDPKDSVAVATIANIDLAAAPATIDGIGSLTGKRVLVKNQSTASQNGVYLYNGTGNAMTRATDADASGELSIGATTYVEAGTAAGEVWIVTAIGADPWVPGTDSSTWSKFLTGVPPAYSGQTTITTLGTIATGIWQGTPIGLAYGGTGATTAAAARTALVAPGKYSETIGDGAATVYVVTHNLNTRDVDVIVRNAASPWEKVYCDDEATTVNTVTVRFTVAPATNAYRVTVIG